jgi:hypothetical protein
VTTFKVSSSAEVSKVLKSCLSVEIPQVRVCMDGMADPVVDPGAAEDDHHSRYE